MCLAVMSAAMLAINDVLIKFLLRALPFYEIIFIRSVIIVLCLICFKKIELKNSREKNDLKYSKPIRLLRTFSLALTGLLFFYSAIFIPLVIATSLALTFPILTSLGAKILLKERLGRKKIAYVAVGFIGSILILGPFEANLQSNYVLPFLMALMCGPLLSFYLVSTRYLRKQVSLVNLTLEPQIGLLLISILMFFISPELVSTFKDTSPQIGMFFGNWKLPVLSDLVLSIAIGLNATLLFYFSMKSYQLAEAPIIAPFEYFVIPFTMIIALPFLGETPDLYQAFGALLVFCSLFLIKKNSNSKFRPS